METEPHPIATRPNPDLNKQASENEDGNQGSIKIKVKAQDGSQVFFKIKRKTKMKKVFNVFCNRRQVLQGTVRFVFDGKRVKQDDSVASLNMEDEDVIEAMVQQTGGILQEMFY